MNSTIDKPDDSGSDEVIRVWSKDERARHERTLLAIRQEIHFLNKLDEHAKYGRVRRAARATDHALKIDLDRSGDDFAWDPKRALDLRYFNYLFFHRNRFTDQIRTWLEIVNAKITHVRANGEDGYFNKLERNIGWTPYITPILFAKPIIADKVVRCGLWSNARNSRRCHQTEFCPFCLWLDILSALADGFGEASGAFARAGAWFFITIGWTTNPANAKCCTGEYNPEDLRPPESDRGYDPYPVLLGCSDADPDLASYGYEDAQILGVVMQWAVAELYHRGFINGYHSRLEGAFRLHPGGANRVHLHQHTVANGDEANAQFLAEQLRDLVYEALAKFGHDLSRQYFPDIQVRRITSSEHLEHSVSYHEKVVPVGHAVEDAQSRPEARSLDGFFDSHFIGNLRVSLMRLINDDIPAIFSGVRFNPELPPLFRRRTGGNMQFNDRGTCIGQESDWHTRKRHRSAKLARESRQRQKEREAKALKAGLRLPAKKQYPRRRKGSRKLPRINKV